MCYAESMDLPDFEQRLAAYRQAANEQAGQAVVDDAWSELLAAATSLQGPPPIEPTREAAAAYAVRDARIAKNEANTFDSIDQTIDDWIDSLEHFHKAVHRPDKH
jgi:hypothetical protein